MMRLVTCACGHPAMRPTGEINRAAKRGWPLWCSRACAGLARRLENPPTAEERRAAKAEYDASYRADPDRKAKKKAQARALHLANYDPEKARVERAAKMPRHVEYCRRPAYRAKKAAYDRAHLAQKHYGPFAEAVLILRNLEAEIDTRATRYEVYAANGTLNKKINRRREYERNRA